MHVSHSELTLACRSLYHIASAFCNASKVVLPPAPPAAHMQSDPQVLSAARKEDPNQSVVAMWHLYSPCLVSAAAFIFSNICRVRLVSALVTLAALQRQAKDCSDG